MTRRRSIYLEQKTRFHLELLENVSIQCFKKRKKFLSLWTAAQVSLGSTLWTLTVWFNLKWILVFLYFSEWRDLKKTDFITDSFVTNVPHRAHSVNIFLQKINGVTPKFNMPYRPFLWMCWNAMRKIARVWRNLWKAYNWSGKGSVADFAFHMNDRMKEPRRDLFGYGIK